MLETVVQPIWLLVMGAIVVESIVNIVKEIQIARNGKSKAAVWIYWTSFVLGLIVGIIVAVNFELDLFEIVGLEGRVPVVGAILTGLIISRGANIVSDILGRINAWKLPSS